MKCLFSFLALVGQTNSYAEKCQRYYERTGQQSNQFNTWKNGPSFTVTVDSVNSLVNIVAQIPNNILFGLNFTEDFNDNGSDFIIMVAPPGGDKTDLPIVNSGWSDGTTHVTDNWIIS